MNGMSLAFMIIISLVLVAGLVTLWRKHRSKGTGDTGASACAELPTSIGSSCFGSSAKRNPVPQDLTAEQGLLYVLTPTSSLNYPTSSDQVSMPMPPMHQDAPKYDPASRLRLFESFPVGKNEWNKQPLDGLGNAAGPPSVAPNHPVSTPTSPLLSM
jgi:hypothetical protein